MIAGMPRKQAGTELVEFAITALLLFVLLFGIIEFSVVLFDKATITNASREGARAGILFRQGPRTVGALADEDSIIEATIRDYAADYLISLGGPAELNIDIQRTDRDGNGEFDAGDELAVTVRYPYDFLILPKLATSLAGDMTLSATSAMRAE